MSLNISSEDISRLGHEVRRFLSKGDLLTRLSGMGTLYLEFPDVCIMHNAHMSIMQAMSKELTMSRPGSLPYEYVDDHTIRWEPLFGVQIVLSCKQRFAVKSGGSVGYRDVAFRTVICRNRNPRKIRK